MIAPALVGPAGIKPLRGAEFRRFQALIHRQSGIFLSEAKTALLVGRLARRLRELGLDSFGAYLERVESNEDELTTMLDAVSTNETHFFREPGHFRLLRERILPAFEREAEEGRRPRRLRAWSAACSSGEEPYSLAMVLLEHFGRGGAWELEILASDLSTRVLRKAREAVYPLQKSKDIPGPSLKRYMLKGTGQRAGEMKVGPEARALVKLARINLAQPLPALGQFDLVFCRNVLIYFTPRDRAQVIARLLGQLSPSGYLFLGHAETLNGLEGVQCVIPTVYRPCPGPRRAALGEGLAS